MKILVVIPELSIGGTERQVTVLARALRERGHTVRILALREPSRPLGACEDLDVEVLGNVSAWSPLFFVRVLRAVRRFAPDVLHTFLFGFDLLPNIAARVTGVPLVVSSRRQLSTWRKRRHLLWQNLGNRFVDAVVANSEAAAEYACLHERFLNRGSVYVLPNAYAPQGREKDDHALPLPQGRRILTVANFWPGKGHETLVRAFAGIAPRHVDAYLWLVGDGGTRPGIEALATELGVAERVVFAGTRRDVGRLLEAATVCVHPSLQESSPNAVLEALARGIPVIATACGGTPELLGGGRYGHLVPPDDPDALGRRIDAVLSDPATAAKTAARFGKEELPDRSPDAVAGMLERTYRALRPSTKSTDAAPSPSPFRGRTVGIYTIGGIGIASARYRCVQFFTSLQRRGIRIEHFALPATRGGRIRQFLGLIRQGYVRRRQLGRAERFDLVVVQKGLTPCRWRGLCPKLAALRVPVLYDLDDAVLLRQPIQLPGPLRRLQDPDEPRRLLERADSVFAGNAYLADLARAHAGTVRMLPTVIDCRRYWWSPPPGQRNTADLTSGIVLVWIGQRSTLPYLVDIVPALAKAAARLAPMPVTVRVICDGFDGLGTDAGGALRIERVRWSLDDEMSQLAGGAIGLMPQPDDDWTRGKCSAKALQYMALGMPVIAAAVGVAPGLVKDGVAGLIVSEAAEWCEAVCDLARDPARRQRMGRQGRSIVEHQYSVERHAETLLEVIEKLWTDLPPRAGHGKGSRS